MTERYLVLENGTVYPGQAFGAPATANIAELVFNTGMTGYQETLTDPSYAGQMLVFTYPTIGNYGINADDNEHATPAAQAVIVQEVAEHPEHWQMTMTLAEWASQVGLPGITGVDTRALTQAIRENGEMRAMVVDNLDTDWAAVMQKTLSTHETVVDLVTDCPTTTSAENGQLTIGVVDFGYKAAIVKRLEKAGVAVRLYPGTVTSEQLLSAQLDGVILSNGPGDPVAWQHVSPMIQAVQAVLPLFGICLGHQLFALANGAKTYRLPFGHRGFNHAVRDNAEQTIAFTSQNHSYAVAADSLADTPLVTTHTEINDGTIEGLHLEGSLAYSVQFHPEACPGPHDADTLFDTFLARVTQQKKVQVQHAKTK